MFYYSLIKIKKENRIIYFRMGKPMELHEKGMSFVFILFERQRLVLTRSSLGKSKADSIYC